MSRRNSSTNETHSQATHERVEENSVGQPKDSLKKDITMFFVIIFVLVGGLAGLWWYDQQTQIVSRWAQAIPLPVNTAPEGVQLEQPQIQIETTGAEEQVPNEIPETESPSPEPENQ